MLEKYRLADLIKLKNSMGIIDKMQYELMLQTLDHIKIGIDGRAAVILQDASIYLHREVN